MLLAHNTYNKKKTSQNQNLVNGHVWD